MVLDLDSCFSLGSASEKVAEMAVDTMKTYLSSLVKGGSEEPVPISHNVDPISHCYRLF